MLWSGTSPAFYNGMLIPIMTLQQKNEVDRNDKDKMSYALMGMVAFGVG